MPATRPAGCFRRRTTISISFSRPAARGRDASRVARLFGISAGRDRIWDELTVELAAGEIVAVVAPSGAGKSVLLRRIARRVPGTVVLDAVGPAITGLPAIEYVGEGPFRRRLDLLSRCGLADAAAIVRPAARLSGGQQWRLALAAALNAATRTAEPRLVIADEFGSGLDAITATVLARQVRSLIRPRRPDAPAMLLATPRAELLPWLRPDRTIVKTPGEPAGVLTRWRRPTGRRRPPWGGFRLMPGRIADYDALSSWHYLTCRPAAHKRVWVVRTSRRPPGAPATAGVLVVSPPSMRCRGRNQATRRRYLGPDHRRSLALLNAEIECISRVVVHPMYRGCGLATALVRHSVATAETPLVEALAVMGGVHPLFEAAGMSRIGRFAGTREYHYFLARRRPAVPSARQTEILLND